MMVQQRLRIAQIAPLAERVPPLKYGGTERVVAALTDELVRRGHEVTLFATGDSETLANLVPIVPSGLRLLPGLEMPRDIHPPQMVQLGCVFEHADAFDVIHSHVDFFTFPFTRLVRTPVLTTMHGRPGLADVAHDLRRLSGRRRELDQPPPTAPAPAGALDR
jgi:glycosyltransferase involved in cell wall biosynthesis